jgi:hypothetical protein
MGSGLGDWIYWNFIITISDNISQPYGSAWTVTGIALPYYYYYYVVCRDVDVFGPKTLLLKHILY